MHVVPVVQSILCLKETTLSGVEVLCRLKDGTSLRSPFGVVQDHEWATIDLQILEILCSIVDDLNDSPTPRIFINVSSASLETTKAFNLWYESILRLAERLKIGLVLEISERIDPLLLRLRWDFLINIPGVQLAIDDFGDANSSLNRLLDYPWSYCKFDARYINRLSHLIAMFVCQSTVIHTIVERVENSSLSSQCKALGLSRQQGFLFSLPEPISLWLASANTKESV